MVVVQVPQLYRHLWKQADGRTKSQQLEEALNSNWNAFPTYSSNSNHLRIEDKHEHLQGGVRNVVDAFVHENVLIWKERQHEKTTGYLRGGPRRKRRKLELEELRARNTRESSLGGAGKALESMQDEGTSETEGEMEALYHRGALEEVEEEED
jgi:hypothetical protein